MKRRGFLSWLGIGGPAAVVASEIKLHDGYHPHTENIDKGPKFPEPEPLPKEAPALKICRDFKLFKNYLYIDCINKLIDFTIPPGYDAVSANTLYSLIQETFDEPEHMQYSIPITAQTPVKYSMINGWSLHESCLNKIADGSISIIKDNWIRKARRQPNRDRKFMSLFSVGHCIKNLRCTWEILVNKELVKVGEFRTIGNFNELIEITGYDQSITTIKVTMDDGRRWKNTFETHTIFDGQFVIPLFPNDFWVDEWYKNYQKWDKEKKKKVSSIL